jgi:hypothetical protein
MIKHVHLQRLNARKAIKNALQIIQCYAQMEIVDLEFMIVMKVNVQVGNLIIAF